MIAAANRSILFRMGLLATRTSGVRSELCTRGLDRMAVQRVAKVNYYGPRGARAAVIVDCPRHDS
jgi:hypothetical protein